MKKLILITIILLIISYLITSFIFYSFNPQYWEITERANCILLPLLASIMIYLIAEMYKN